MAQCCQVIFLVLSSQACDFELDVFLNGTQLPVEFFYLGICGLKMNARLRQLTM